MNIYYFGSKHKMATRNITGKIYWIVQPKMLLVTSINVGISRHITGN